MGAVLAFTRRSCRELGFSSAQDLHFGPSLQVARDQWTALLAIPVVHSVYPPASPRATSACLESRSRPSASCLQRPGSDSGAEEGCDLPLRFTMALAVSLFLLRAHGASTSHSTRMTHPGASVAVVVTLAGVRCALVTPSLRSSTRTRPDSTNRRGRCCRTTQLPLSPTHSPHCLYSPSTATCWLSGAR